MRVGRHVQDLPVGGDELDRDDVVRGEAVLRHQPAEAAAEGEAGDPGRRDRATRNGETVLRRRVVELSPGHATLSRDEARLGVDGRGLHLGQVDHHRPVGDREPADVVPAAAYGDLRVRGAREANRGGDVGGRAAADDKRRPTVDHSVVDASRVVVAVVSR